MTKLVRFTFSWKVSLISFLLIAGALRLSYWQWQRHEQKKELIAVLNERLEQEPVPLLPLIEDPKQDWDSLVHRRVLLTGTFDFSHEVVLRNRRYRGLAGTFVLTPFKLAGSDDHILVSRGFIPLQSSGRDKRGAFHHTPDTPFVGLVKERARRKFLAPADPESGPGKVWVDKWLRVDIPAIAKQLPYTLLPVWIEMMDSSSLDDIRASIVKSSEGRSELLSLATRAVVQAPQDAPATDFPVPQYDIIIPAGRHLGYVFEWAFMALGVLLAAIVLQLRRPKSQT